MSTFYRTVITVEVLSQEPISDPVDLDEINYMITDGECSGQLAITSTEEVDGPTMAKLLIAQGSDTEFFNLDEDGNDLDEDEES